jgi:hypothetical protein
MVSAFSSLRVWSQRLAFFCAGALLAPNQSEAKCMNVAAEAIARQTKTLLDLRGETVKVVQKIPGKYGGHRLVLRRRLGEPWLGTTDEVTPQGSPLWIFDMLSPEAAEFFGFSRNGNVITVPDHDEFIGALRKFNSLKKDRNSPVATWGVYLESNLRAPDESYLRRIATDGLLAWAEKGNLFHHDLYFHVLTILGMPTEILNLIRRQLLALFEFRAFIERKYPEMAGTSAFRKYFQSYFKKVAENIDLGTGRVPQSAAALTGKNLPHDFNFIQLAFSSGLSPHGFLQETVRDPELAGVLKEFQNQKLQSDPKYNQGLTDGADPEWVRRKIIERLAAVEAEVRKRR